MDDVLEGKNRVCVAPLHLVGFARSNGVAAVWLASIGVADLRLGAEGRVGS